MEITFPHKNDGIRIQQIERKVHRNTGCAENTEKGPHRTISKVYKSICFSHTKFRILPIFFDPRKNFVEQRDPYGLCQSLTDGLTTAALNLRFFA